MLRTRLPSHLLPPRAVLLARDVVLLTLPEGAHTLSGNHCPSGTVTLTTRNGPLKIAALRSAAAARGDDDIDILVSGSHFPEPVPPILLGRDVLELTDEVESPSHRRLLGFLLGFCRKAFDLGRDDEFAANCLRLAQNCGRDAGSVEPIAHFAGKWQILRSEGSVATDTAYLINQQCVRKTQILALTGHRAFAVEGARPGDHLLSLNEGVTLWEVVPPASPTPDLARQSKISDALRDAAFATLIEGAEDFRARVKEASLLQTALPIRHDDPRRPLGAGLDDALADGHGKLFLRGWLRDPHDLVVAAELAGPTGRRPLELASLHRYRRADLDKHFAASPFRGAEGKLGFVALLEDQCPRVPYQPTLHLQMQSGAAVAVRAPLGSLDPAVARATVLSSVPLPDVTDEMFEQCLSPAAAAFHTNVMMDRPRPDVVTIGEVPKRPEISVIIPLYKNLSFLRFQIAAFARDANFRAAELIYVLDSPEQRAEVEHMLRGLHLMHDMPIRLIVMRRNLGYAAANNAGAAHASGEKLLLLNSDVVPAGSGWLAVMSDALDQPGVGAVGPKLLFDEGSIQHAGLYFRRDGQGIWLNDHYWKGFPASWPAANRACHMPGVTGAAMMTRRSAFQDLGGISEDYIIGDYEDSDYCIRLHSHGLGVFFVPSASLFHFERRSIVRHLSYNGTLASRHNRMLQHHRWTDTIEDLMKLHSPTPAGLAA